MTTMNDELQVMSRPNAAQAQEGGGSQQTAPGLLNGVSTQTPQMSNLNMAMLIFLRISAKQSGGFTHGLTADFEFFQHAHSNEKVNVATVIHAFKVYACVCTHVHDCGAQLLSKPSRLQKSRS